MCAQGEMRTVLIVSGIAVLLLAGGGPTSASAGWDNSQFYGLACVQTECGESVTGLTVTAEVNGVECGSDVTEVPFADGEPMAAYAIDVKTDAEKAGCAEPGDTIQFYIDGEPANPTAVWEEGSHHLDIHTGPDFATFSGTLTCHGEPCIEFVVGPAIAPYVRAYVDGKLCAGHAVSGWLITSYYNVNIPSDEAVPGCGTEGATVTFTVDGEPANEVAVWTTGYTTFPLTTGDLVWGDVNCSGRTDPVDALGLLRFDAGLPVGMPYGCRVVGVTVQVNGTQEVWGNFDCIGGIDAVDALKTLKFDAGREYESACPE